MPRSRNPLTPEQRAEISRRNGAQSRGPTTDTGKAISSKNATRHGMASLRHIVLHSEDPDLYLQIEREYFDTLQPQTPVERDLVYQLAQARWRLRRVLTYETTALDNAVALHGPAIHAAHSEIDQSLLNSLSFQSFASANNCPLERLHRYEAAALRSYDKALRALHLLRRARGSKSQPPPDPLPQSTAAAIPETPPASPSPQPNEPTEHSSRPLLSRFRALLSLWLWLALSIQPVPASSAGMDCRRSRAAHWPLAHARTGGTSAQPGLPLATSAAPPITSTPATNASKPKLAAAGARLRRVS